MRATGQASAGLIRPFHHLKTKMAGSPAQARVMTSDVSGCRDLVTDDPAIDGAEHAASTATIAIASTVASTIAAATAANHNAAATTATDTSSAATATASAAAARRSLRAGSYHHQRCRADEAETINAGQDHPGDQTRQDAATTGWIIRHRGSPFCKGLDAGPGFAWGQWGTRDGAVRWAVARVRNLQLHLFSDECSCRLRGEHSLCVVPEFAWTTNEREV